MRRVAISELTGSLLMIALTLIAGAAVFAWVNSQAGVSEGALGAQAANQANYFKESFVIVGVQFYYNNGVTVGPCYYSNPNTYCNEFTVYVYNNGAVPLTIESVEISNYATKYGSGSTAPLLIVSYSLTDDTYTTGSGSASYTCGADTSLSSSPYSSVTTFNEPAYTSGLSVSQPLAEESAPPAAYTFAIPPSPGCALSSSIVDGASYTIQLVGLYGNIVTTEVTANG